MPISRVVFLRHWNTIVTVVLFDDRYESAEGIPVGVASAQVEILFSVQSNCRRSVDIQTNAQRISQQVELGLKKR